ncbi:hypothetical protein [Coleofasciculus sp.]|uniref:hypothetical protein n=1 Tax=Coleofasciculus sp. TaxID=3100458 RepID=UPI003A43ED35
MSHLNIGSATRPYNPYNPYNPHNREPDNPYNPKPDNSHNRDRVLDRVMVEKVDFAKSS